MLPLVLIVAAQVSGGSPWATSLPSDVVATYLDGDAPSVVVVNADAEAASVEASAALEASLKQNAKIRLVMNGVSLGDVKQLGDQDIAKKAAGLPINTVIIVRTFAGADVTLVATFYGTDGKLRSALTVVRGSALTPRQAGAGRGVSSAALDAVREATHTEKEEGYAGFDSMKWMGQNTGFLTTRTGNRYVTGTEFYSLLGRDDLAVAFGARQAGRAVLLGIGIVGVTIGGIAAPLAIVFAATCAFTSCSPLMTTFLVASLVTLGVGVIGLIGRAILSGSPMTEAEEMELVADFNKKSAEKKTSSARKDPPIKVSVGIAPVNNGALLALSGTF